MVPENDHVSGSRQTPRSAHRGRGSERGSLDLRGRYFVRTRELARDLTLHVNGAVVAGSIRCKSKQHTLRTKRTGTKRTERRRHYQRCRHSGKQSHKLNRAKGFSEEFEGPWGASEH